jgi:hypothetical protein
MGYAVGLNLFFEPMLAEDGVAPRFKNRVRHRGYSLRKRNPAHVANTIQDNPAMV